MGIDTIADTHILRFLVPFDGWMSDHHPKLLLERQIFRTSIKKATHPLTYQRLILICDILHATLVDFGEKRWILPQYFSLFLACHVKLPETSESVWLLTLDDFCQASHTDIFSELCLLYHNSNLFQPLSQVSPHKHRLSRHFASPSG